MCKGVQANVSNLLDDKGLVVIPLLLISHTAVIPENYAIENQWNVAMSSKYGLRITRFNVNHVNLRLMRDEFDLSARLQV